MTTRRLAFAGLVGPPLFAAIVLLVTALEWDFLHDIGWSAAPFDNPDPPWPSSTALGDYGFLQVLNFLLLGLSVLALAVVLFRLLDVRRKVGPSLLALTGAALCLSAIRADYGMVNGGGPDTWNGFMHALAFTILLPAALAAMFVLAAQFRRDERWRSLSRYSVLAGALVLGGIVGTLAGGGTVFFWLFLAALLGWLMFVAGRALVVST